MTKESWSPGPDTYSSGHMGFFRSGLFFCFVFSRQLEIIDEKVVRFAQSRNYVVLKNVGRWPGRAVRAICKDGSLIVELCASEDARSANSPVEATYMVELTYSHRCAHFGTWCRKEIWKRDIPYAAAVNEVEDLFSEGFSILFSWKRPPCPPELSDVATFSDWHWYEEKQ